MRSGYTCMIVDDEQDAIDYLSSLINEHYPLFKIVATAGGSADAVKKYFKTLPDLVFLDIEVDEDNGFDIIEKIYNEKRKPYIIFVTAYDKYAIEAFKANALGYLLKPVEKEDLENAVNRFIESKGNEFHIEKIQRFLEGRYSEIRFNTGTGFILLNPAEILYCEADHNYTRIVLSPEKSYLVSIHLAMVEEKLNSPDFVRISRAILVNTKYLRIVNRRKKTCILHWQNQEIVLTGSDDMIRKL